MLKQDASTLRDSIIKVQRKIRDRERAISSGEKPLYDVTTQMYPNIADQLKSEIHHEMGHYVDRQLGRISEKLRVKPASIYGKSAENENFAEWHAIYRMQGKREFRPKCWKHSGNMTKQMESKRNGYTGD